MRVIHVISSLDKGGAESQLVYLIQEQIKQNLEINVCYLRGNSYWVKFLESKNVKCHFLDYSKTLNIFSLLKSIIKMLLIISKFKPNIIHAHLNPSEILMFFVSLFYKKYTYIISKHLDSFIISGSDNNKSNFFYSLFEDLILIRSDKIICISKSVFNFFKINTFVAHKKLKHIYYGIDYKNYQNQDNRKYKITEFYKKYKISKKLFIVGIIARLVPQKNIPLMLKSYKTFKEKYHLNSKLIIVGDGYLNKKLKKISKDMKISDEIIWIKYYEENKILFDIFNVFCLTSNYEGLGLVLLEALSSGTPIITVKRSAMQEIIKNNKNGFLIEPNDYERMAYLLFNVSLNSPKIRMMSRSGKKLVKKKFNLSIMAQKVFKIYKNNY